MNAAWIRFDDAIVNANEVAYVSVSPSQGNAILHMTNGHNVNVAKMSLSEAWDRLVLATGAKEVGGVT